MAIPDHTPHMSWLCPLGYDGATNALVPAKDWGTVPLPVAGLAAVCRVCTDFSMSPPFRGSHLYFLPEVSIVAFLGFGSPHLVTSRGIDLHMQDGAARGMTEKGEGFLAVPR
jgi:hypothetical protein